MRKVLIWVALLPIFVHGQQHSPKIQWTKIETPHFKIIAPKQIEDKALETANLLEHVYKPVSSTLHYARKKLPVVLMNQSVVSNAFVSLAPSYSGFYTTPMQEANILGGNDWFQTIAVHEYRHYVQLNKLNDHFTQFARGFFGENGQAFLTLWSTPLWVLEGDAICTETSLTSGGRGRLPAFSKGIRAHELEGIRYKYDKAYLGSYKDYVPNHYHLGYTLCSGLKSNYGLENWDKMMTRATRFSFWPYSFTRSTKKYSRIKFKHNYQAILDEHKILWAEKSLKQHETSFTRIDRPKKVFTNYTYPFLRDDGSVLCMRNGMADVPKLCLLKGEEEQTLCSINPRERIHSNGKHAVWSITTHDIRWGERSFSDIVIYNIDSDTKRKLTHRQKYFAPAISPGGDRIVAVEYTENLECKLVILDAESGDVVGSNIASANNFIRMPSWSDDEKQVLYTQSAGQKMTLMLWNVEDHSITTLLPWSKEVISAPVFYQDYILYNSPYMGVDAIYALHPETGRQTLVAASKYGVYNPSVLGDKLTFQTYTTKGYSVAHTPIRIEEWMDKAEVEPMFDNYYQGYLQQEPYTDIFADSTGIVDRSETFEIKKYRPLLKAIKIHSWSPNFIPNGFGYSVQSNDILNTSSIHAGLNYFPKDKATGEFIALQFARYFPVFELSAALGQSYENGLYADDYDALYGFQERELGIGVRLPINLSSENYSTDVDVTAAYKYIQQTIDEPANGMPGRYDFTGLNLALHLSNVKHQAMRDLYPRYGQDVRIGSWFSPSRNHLLATQGKVYLPGLFKHHSLAIEGGYEKSTFGFDRGVYTLPTEIAFVKGYGKVYSDLKYNLSASYAFPLAYPDFRIGPVFYMKRIHTAGFFDYGQAERGSSRIAYSSAGFDLNFEVNFFRFIQPIELGLRHSYLIDQGAIAIELLLFRKVL